MPPVAVMLADPLLPPLHDTFVDETDAVSAVGSATITHLDSMHPLASVIIT